MFKKRREDLLHLDHFFLNTCLLAKLVTKTWDVVSCKGNRCSRHGLLLQSTTSLRPYSSPLSLKAARYFSFDITSLFPSFFISFHCYKAHRYVIWLTNILLMLYFKKELHTMAGTTIIRSLNKSVS